MTWRSVGLAASLLLTTNTAGHAAETSDSCRRQLPASLVAAIAVEFHTYRAPLEADNLKEDIQTAKRNGGSKCLGVAVGDFDGSGASQYLLGLSAQKGNDGLIVIAQKSGQHWAFQRLSNWKAYRDRLYVDVVRPGTYLRTDALDSSLSTGERFVLHCRYSGAVFGETESTEAVYCRVSGKWLYVQTSN